MSGARVYLAGPDVFLPDAADFLEDKRRLCAKHGFVGIPPFDSKADLALRPKREAARNISAANEAPIRQCDMLIANLTPIVVENWP